MIIVVEKERRGRQKSKRIQRYMVSVVECDMVGVNGWRNWIMGDTKKLKSKIQVIEFEK